MKFSIEKTERFAVVSIIEENLNHAVAAPLKLEFVMLQNEGIPNLILDISEVKYADSSGLAAILTGNRLWRHTGLFVLTGVRHETIRKLVEISRLDMLIVILSTVEDARRQILLDEIERNLHTD